MGEVNKVTAAGSQTAAGESGNAPITIDKGKAYVDSNYGITEKPGALTVTPRTVVMTSETLTKEYDGTLTVTEKKQTDNGGDPGDEDNTDSEDSHHHHYGHSGTSGTFSFVVYQDIIIYGLYSGGGDILLPVYNRIRLC